MNLKSAIRISYRKCFLYMILLPYLKPYNVTLIPWLDNIYKAWKIVATLLIIFEFLRKKTRLHRSSVYLFAFLMTWMISLLINHAPIIDFGNNILSILGIMLLFEENYNNKFFKANLTKVLYSVAYIYILLNLITVMMGMPFFSAGIKLDDNANFLGGDNYSAFILITLCGFMFFNDLLYYKNIRTKTWVVAFIGLACLSITFAFTGMLAYAIFLISVLFYRYSLWEKLLRWRNVVAFCACLVIAIAYLHLDQLGGSFLKSIGKTGFNGRNMIWPRVITAIIKKPLLGYGGVDTELAATWFIAGANHAHNFLLEYPFSTGVIGTIFFVAYFTNCLKKTLCKDNRDIRVLLLTLGAYIICSTFDFYIGLIYFYLLMEMIWLYKIRGNNQAETIVADD